MKENKIQKPIDVESGAHGRMSVLLLDDDPTFRSSIRSMLAESAAVHFDLTETTTAKEFKSRLAAKLPDVVLIELDLPDISGLELLRKTIEGGRAPVVVVCLKGNEHTAVDALKAGAYDYIPKDSLNSSNLISALRSANEKWKLLKQDERHQEKLTHQATHDALTDLLMRNALFDRLEGEIQRTRRYDRPLTIFMADIDHFKQINDTHGHVAGDAVLRSIASTLKKNVRGSDFIGRYGGEEFLIVLPETALDPGIILAEKVRQQVARTTIRTEGKIINGITISMGGALYEKDPSLAHFIDRSDALLYKAKKSGRNQVQPLLGEHPQKI